MIQRVINGLIILMLNMASSNYADLLSVKVWPPTLASQLGPVWRFGGGGGWREGGRVRIRGKERNGRKKEEACRMAEQEGGTTKGEGKIGRKQRGGRNLEGKKKWCWEEVGWMRRGGALVWPSVLNSSIFFLSSPPLSTPPVDRREELCSERSRLTSVASPPHPMRYVTGPSPAISSCCHHLFIFPGSSSSPRVCPQRRLVQVSLTSASTVAANRFRAGAHRAECKVLPRLLSAAMLHSEGRYLLTCVARSGKEGNRAGWVQCGWTPTVPALLRQRDPVRSIYFLAAHKPQKGSVVL